MKIAIVVNNQKYPYHQNIICLLRKCSLGKENTTEVIDMSEKIPLHEKYYKIIESGCNFLISLDCAGFELRTELETLSYNNLGCRVAHLILQNINEFTEELGQQMNFSMFLFGNGKEQAEAIKERHADIVNVGYFEQIDYKDNSPEAEKRTIEILETWWEKIKKTAELE